MVCWYVFFGFWFDNSKFGKKLISKEKYVWIKWCWFWNSEGYEILEVIKVEIDVRYDDMKLLKKLLI